MRTLSLLVLVGIAVVGPVEAGCLGPEVAFEALSEYLGQRVASDDSEANLEQLRADLKDNQLAGAMRGAAEVLLALSEVVATGKGGQCNGQVLSLLKRAQQLGLRARGEGRISQVVVGLIELFDNCQSYVCEQFQQRLEADDRWLFKLLTKADEQHKFATIFDWPSSNGRQKSHLAKQMRLLARDDPEANCGHYIDGRRVVDEQKFEYAFNKYLAHPYQQFQARLGDLMLAFQSIRELYTESHEYYSILSNKSPQFNRAVGLQEASGRILNMSPADKAYLAKKFCL